jgi:urease accessory protein
VSDLSLGAGPLVRLLQLVSPTLPIGTFAYSHGLEAAVELGFVDDAESTAIWTEGLLRDSFQTWEIPMLVRLYRGFATRETNAVRYWNDRLFASRPTSELAEEDRQLGVALARILTQLGLIEAARWWADPRVTYEAMFALACARWNIPMEAGARAYAFGWCEMLVAAATKLVPLGQTAGQQILLRLGLAVGPATDRGLLLPDDEMSAFAPAHAMVSAAHETQYARLFRS